jgi:hypothetical protein
MLFIDATLPLVLQRTLGRNALAAAMNTSAVAGDADVKRLAANKK